ncbi:hypothetical protein HRI96_06050 [Treponema parvum]|uniref:Uncharacterized protein n=1 Tax=Treponema parvum TaxID=138851 RepID=A0A975EZH8_9SPIR|nr:hypothetical protein [Treponema parvum]QTQ11801.1 hypothetical protein HRI96_06050 [Treponema parvum]
MRIKKNIVISFTIVFLSLVALFAFRRVSHKKLWTGYQTLAVAKTVSEKDVLYVLNNSGCSSVVSLSSQPQMQSSPYSPVQKKVQTPSYSERQKEFFFDKNDDFQLYYIPERYSASTEKAFRTLNRDYNANSYLDSKADFPKIPLVVCFIFASFLCFFSKSRPFFFVTAFFPLLFALSRPSLSRIGAVCLLLYGLYALQDLRRRNESLYVLLHSRYAVLFTILPVVLCFFSSFSSGIIFIAALSASFAAENLLHDYEIYRAKKSAFSMVLILPSQFIRLTTRKTVLFMYFCALITGLFLVLSVFSSRFLSSKGSKDLLLPAPARYNNKTSIISLTDYVASDWYAKTYPYRSLHDEASASGNVRPGDAVIIPRYERDGDVIREKNEVVFSFDKAFIDSTVKNIDGLPDTALEKILKKQGKADAAVYSLSGGNGFRDFIILLIEFMISSAVLIFFILRNHRLI